VASVLALPAVAGKFGVRGGGYTMSNSGAYPEIRRANAVAESEPGTRIVNMNRLGEVLLGEIRDDSITANRETPVKVIFVYNCNPLATMPNQEKVRQGLAREDLFTVVFEQAWTDTAHFADLVLPATTFLEHDEMSRGYGSYIVHRLRPVATPAGEARPNYEVFHELLRRLGLDRPGDPEGPDGLQAAVLQSADRLRNDLDEASPAFPDCGEAPVQFVDAFPFTPDRKIHLVPEALDREAPYGLYSFQEDPATGRYPLALVSASTGRTISSSLGSLYRDVVPLEIHPADAARRGIRHGDTIRIWNDLGEVRTKARLSAEMRPGVVFLPKGLWSHNTLSGTTSNALSPDTYTDLGQGACFNDARVEVEVVHEQ